MSGGRGTRSGAWLGLAACALAALVGLRLATPPEALPATAAAERFSAVRAARHVRALAAAPRPPGTDTHAAALEYIRSELAALGLEGRVQEGWATEARGANATAIRVRNVMARIEGGGSGDRAVLLLSHYDSVPTGPGAADAAAGVATLLETARALRQRERLANDVILLATDGEEAGLFGARLFVDEHPWASEVGLVLNFEARGNRGPVQMFETSDGNVDLVRGLAAASPHPFASSMSYEVYRRMPNDTDLSVFLEAGYAGLNFAMIGNHPAYHSELDRPEALSPSSLQHHGSYALALARHFGAADLAALDRSRNLIYFNPLGSVLLVYSEVTGRALALLALLAVAGLIAFGLRRGRLSGSGLSSALWTVLVTLLIAPLALGAAWNLFERLFPAALASPHGEPYWSDGVRVAALLVVLAVATFTLTLFERCRPLEILSALLGVWSLLGVGVALLVPGASYLTAWPTLAGAAGLALAIRWPGGRLPIALAALGGVVAALLFAPLVVLVSEALGVDSAALLGLLLALPVGLVLPVIAPLVRGRLAVPLALGIAGAGLLAWIGLSAAPRPETPAPTTLFYLLDLEGPAAWWLSHDTAPNAWTAQVIPPATEQSPLPEYLPARPGARLRRVAAPPVDLPGPEAELLADELVDDVRRLELRVRSPRGAPFLVLAVDSSMATIRSIGVEGRLEEVDQSAGRVTLTIQNLPAAGVVVAVETFDRQPIALDLIDWSWGLPAVGGEAVTPRPASLVRGLRWMSDTLQVRRQIWF